MAMLRLLSTTPSPYARKVRIALHESFKATTLEIQTISDKVA